MRKFISLVILLIAVSAPLKLAAEEKIPAPVGWVNDFVGIIDDGHKKKIEAIIEETERATSAEIAVAVFDSIAPYDEASYARLVFDSWKIGKKGKDNGVLILIALAEHRWRIEVGYGLEGILPDGLCGQIGRSKMVPLFKQDKYAEGIYEGVATIAAVIAKEYKTDLSTIAGVDTTLSPEKNRDIDFVATIFLTIFLLVLLLTTLQALDKRIWIRLGDIPAYLISSYGLLRGNSVYIAIAFFYAFLWMCLLALLSVTGIRTTVEGEWKDDRWVPSGGGIGFGGGFGGGGGGFGGFGGGGGGGGGAGGGW